MHDRLVEKMKDGKLDCVLYTSKLYSAYHDFPRERIRLAWWAIISGLICAASIYFWLVLVIMR